MNDIEKKFSVRCIVCGSDQFYLDDNMDDLINAPDETEIKCADCGRVYTKSELINENSDIINANIDDLKDEIISEIKKDFKKMLNY